MSTLAGYVAGIGTAALSLGVGFAGGLWLTDAIAVRHSASEAHHYAQANVQPVSRPDNPSVGGTATINADDRLPGERATGALSVSDVDHQPVTGPPDASSPSQIAGAPAKQMDAPKEMPSTSDRGKAERKKLAAEKKRYAAENRKKQAIARAKTLRSREARAAGLASDQAEARTGGLFGAGPSFFSN